MQQFHFLGAFGYSWDTFPFHGFFMGPRSAAEDNERKMADLGTHENP